MLLKLYVKNYALIKDLDVELENGLTIITGETGAGKSILLGALSLILGNRADTSVLLEKNEKCVVEGTFRIDGYDLAEFFNSNSLDYELTVILRREINPAGKSRAFINDTPVTVNLLKELGEKLIERGFAHEHVFFRGQANVVARLGLHRPQQPLFAARQVRHHGVRQLHLLEDRSPAKPRPAPCRRASRCCRTCPPNCRRRTAAGRPPRRASPTQSPRWYAAGRWLSWTCRG